MAPVEQLGDRRAKPVPLADQPLGRPGRDDLDGALEQLEAMPELACQRLALPSAHPAAIGGGLTDDRLHLAPGNLERTIVRGGQDVRLPSDELDGDLARQSQSRLQFPQPAGYQTGAVQIDREPSLTLGVLGPPDLHREMPAIEIPPEPLPQLPFHHRQLSRQLGAQVEIPVVDGADLDPEPSPTGGSFRCAEPCHAVRHSASAWPGKPGKLVAEVLSW